MVRAAKDFSRPYAPLPSPTTASLRHSAAERILEQLGSALYDGPGKTADRIVVTPLTIEIEETKRGGVCGIGPATTQLRIFQMSELAKLELRGNKIRGYRNAEYLLKVDTYPCYNTGCCAVTKGGFTIELPDNEVCKELFMSLVSVWRTQHLSMIC
jgi:hypothetical protein